ncbi:hypothetical protein [Streptomyces sp. CA-132043]|uniref:hypothetical protein n=1 Tax=Streptomyces sp. CA-132043 TaxID=3240048 RepID=UPI003D925146
MRDADPRYEPTPSQAEGERPKPEHGRPSDSGRSRDMPRATPSQATGERSDRDAERHRER